MAFDKTTNLKGFNKQNTYKTAQEIDAEARLTGMEFVTYPNSYDFNNPSHRRITKEEEAALATKQKQLKTEVVDFYHSVSPYLDQNTNKMLSDLISSKLHLFLTTITSGASININQLKVALLHNKNDVKAQTRIVNQLCGQLNVAAFKGYVRLYETKISQIQGNSNKYSEKIMYQYNQIMKNASFEISTDPNSRNEIFDIIKQDISDLSATAKQKSRISPKYPQGYYMPKDAEMFANKTAKEMESYATVYNIKNRPATSTPVKN